ncbi:MAG: energy-coupling factor transporter ATPase [Nitrospirales bacterium]
MKTGTSRWRPFDWITEVTSVWHDTRLIVLTAQIAAIYAAILIPFKVGIPIIPGFVELRPANAIPLVTSLLFGPTAAWGAGIGNIIGDCFGTLGPASVFGFVGNFFLGLIPYVLWGHLGPLSSKQVPQMKSWRQGLEFSVICVIASGVCAATIAWGVELLGLLPFWILAPAIFFNNVIMGIFLGPPLLLFLYPRVQRWGLYYPDLCRELRESQQNRTDQLPRIKDTYSEDDQGSKSMVEIENVTFRYQAATTPVLRDLSLHVQKGEKVVLMGGRGSGKSTLCHCFNGLIPHFIRGAFSGTVKVDGKVSIGRSVASQSDKVGIVFQDFDTQLLSTNVERELVFPLEYAESSLSVEDMKKRIQWSIEQVGLEQFIHRDPLSLSGGQRQRLVLGSVLVSHPALLVLDQPMTDLDPEARRNMHKLFELLSDQGITIVLSEQESEEVLDADRICVLQHGSVCWEGDPHELFRQPELVKQFGLASLPLTECFTELHLTRLPVTVEEAWKVTDELGLTLEPTVKLTERGHGVNDWSIGSTKHEPLIGLETVSFGYTQDTLVLNAVSLSVLQGEFVAVLGKNGSGKSTLGKLLNGLLLPTMGDVIVGRTNTKTARMDEISRIVGYVFQNPDQQIFAETVWDEVGFSPKNHGFTSVECEQRIVESLTAVGLDVEASKTQDPFSLSKGDRQRVAVASILAAKPDLLIFDEPTTGLDVKETQRMMNMIRLLHQQGHTIVMITHTLRLVSDYATRCIVMNEGTVIADGATRSVFSDPSLLQAASLEVPPLTRYGQRWGHTLLTIDEVKTSLKFP